MPVEPKTPSTAQRQHPYPTPTSHSKSDKSLTYSKSYDPPSPSKVITIEESDDDALLSRHLAIDDSDDVMDGGAGDEAGYAPALSETDDTDGESDFEPESDDDIKPTIKGKKATQRARATKVAVFSKGRASTTVKKERPIASGGGGSARKGEPWTAEEDWVFFQMRYPKTAVKWQEVAAATGRDAKSCSNRDAVFAKKLPALIKTLGNS